MEIRYFAPGNLVSNLDFVENIFGNGGDPNLPENDAGLDTEHWTGHTGCVILAPHLTTITKKDAGQPHWDKATERQRRDGDCWKEVKTQISYAANLYGLCEEEHAGGALVFPAYDLGEEFSGDVHVKRLGHSFAEVSTLYRDFVESKPEGYAVDKKFPDILYVPEDARFDLHTQRISWPGGKTERSIKLLPD